VCCDGSDGSDASQFHVMQVEGKDEANGIAHITRITPASFM
jgi:hypothetical protein